MRFRKKSPYQATEKTRYLSSTEAARRMGLSSETVRRLCKDGVLPGAFQRKQGGPWYIPEENVLSWLESPKHFVPASSTLDAKTKRGSFHKYFGKLIGAVVTFIAILAVISVLADYQAARQQLADWGIYVPIHPERRGEILIIIAKFQYSQGVVNVQADREILGAINKSAQLLNLSSKEFRIESLPKTIEIDDILTAQRIAEKYDAHVVIWGSDTGVRVTVNFLNNKGHAAWTAPIAGYYVVGQNSEKIPSSSQTITITETENSQLGNPKGYSTFVTNDLPQQLTFLSFFVIGQSFYPKDFHRCSEFLEQSLNYPTSDKSATGLLDEAYYWQGVCHIEGGNVPKGIISLEKSIGIKPRNIFALLRLSQSLWDIDRYDDAKKYFSRLIDVLEASLKGDPHKFSSYKLFLGLVYQGRGLVQLEQVAQGEGQSYREDQKFEDNKLKDPAYSFQQYAEIYYRNDKTELLASVADLEMARQLCENDFLADGSFDLREKITVSDLMADEYGALMKLGKFQDALNMVYSMDKIADTPLNNYYKALAYEALGELPEALENYELYITRDPAYQEEFIPDTISYLKKVLGLS
jgi:excisionase family DNA binding protein